MFNTDDISNENGAAIRASNARLIFLAKAERSALEMVANGNRVDYRIISEAKRLATIIGDK